MRTRVLHSAVYVPAYRTVMYTVHVLLYSDNNSLKDLSEFFPPSECIEFHLDIKGYPKSLLPNSNSSQDQQQQSKGYWMDLNKAKPNECFIKFR